METAKERVLKAVAHQQPETVPVNVSNIYDPAKFMEYLGVDSGQAIRDRLEVDLDYARPVYTGPLAAQGLDIWGTPIENIFGADGAGYSAERGGYPLEDAETVADVDRFPWPDPDHFDYEVAARSLAKIPNTQAKRLDCKYGIVQPGQSPDECQSGGAWLPVLCTLLNLFGFERALMNFSHRPKVAEAALARLEEFMVEFTRRSLDAAGDGADLYFHGDDFSTQQGLMISPAHWRRFLKPVFAKVFALVKDRGLRVWFHSCGQFRPVMPDLIDIGMDVWETVQVHLAGNDPRELKEEYGKDITFFGAICTQKTLPFGSEEDVRKEVRERIEVLGRDGGYICGPDHGVMPDVPVENVVALVDEAKKFQFA